MTKVTIDHAMRDKLRNLSEPVEFCDEDGRVLGYFTPMVDRLTRFSKTWKAGHEGEFSATSISDRHADSRRSEGR